MQVHVGTGSCWMKEGIQSLHVSNLMRERTMNQIKQRVEMER